MLATELMSLLHLGHLRVTGPPISGIYLSPKFGQCSTPHFHVLLSRSSFLWWHVYELKDVNSNRILSRDSNFKELWQACVDWLETIEQAKADKTRAAIQQAISGELDRMIKDHDGNHR